MLSHLLLVFALLRSVDSFVGGFSLSSSATVLKRNFAVKPSAIAVGKREVKADRERLPSVAGLRMGDNRRRTNAFYFPREDALSTLIRKKLELPGGKKDTKGLLGGSNELEKNELEDTMGQHNAIYAILWKKDEKDGLFRVADEYTLESRKQAMRRVRGDDKTFASESAKLSIPGTGPNLIALADREQREQIIDNPSDIWSPERRELAFTFGIKYIHFAPVPGQPGMVIEYGRASAQTSKADRQKEMESCMGRYNAVYTLLWKKDAKGVFFVQDQYTLESRKKALRRVRGDDRTFASESAKISIPGTGSNLIATADREGTLYTSAYVYKSVYVSIRQHTSAYASIRQHTVESHRQCYIGVVILPYMCPHTTVCVSSYYYVCVLILLYMCRHTPIHVSSYYCIYVSS